MIILGIDPGYGRLGYAVLKKSDPSSDEASNKEELLDYSCIETDPKKEHNKRILEITNNIEKIIKKYKPEILSIEKLFFTKNQKTALQVSEIKGIIIYICLKNKMKIAEFTPLEVKTAVCGYGKASKEQVQKMIELLVKIKEPIKYDDTADAIALCLTCSSTQKYQKLFTK